MLTIEVESSDSVKQLKCKIEDMEGMPVERQRLIATGRALEINSMMLGDYNIQPGVSLLHLVFDRRGR